MYADIDRAAYAHGRQSAGPRSYRFHVFLLVFAGYNAILFAALLLVPSRLWWAVVAAALPAHLLAELQGGVPVVMVLCWFVSNMTEALIGAACVRLLVREPVTFETPRDVSAFLFAASIATFLSSLRTARAASRQARDSPGHLHHRVRRARSTLGATRSGALFLAKPFSGRVLLETICQIQMVES